MVGRIVNDLKDENEQYRRMVIESIDKVVQNLGTADIDARMEEVLVDGILYCFQEQVLPCRGAAGGGGWGGVGWDGVAVWWLAQQLAAAIECSAG